MEYEVTIGIPVYNTEEYAKRMMESVMAQTFESIEILILDDCGTDASMDIIRDYQQNHPRGKDIRIVRQPRNMGIGEARCRLVTEARGKYFFFLDADDAIAPNAIELLHDNAIRYQADIVYGSYEQYFTKDNKTLEKRIYRYETMHLLEPDSFAQWAYAKYSHLQAQTWNFLIDLEIYRKNNLNYMPLNFWEDFTFTINLPIYIHRAVLLSDITYFYYRREGSLSVPRRRNHIDKSETDNTISSLNQLKFKIDIVRNKPYFSRWLFKIMMTEFYVVCNIISKRHIISPKYSDRELRDAMKSPLSLKEILELPDLKVRNFAMYMLGVMPPVVSVNVVRLLGKGRGLIT